MRGYLLRRILLTIPTVFGVITLVFFLVHMIPGDPVDAILGETAQAADKDSLRRELKLDLPISEQYITYITGIFQGELGESIAFNRPVTDVVLERIPATILLGFSAIVFAVILAVPTGVLAAVYKDEAPDRLSLFVSLLGISIPNFWLGPLLIILFAVQWNLLPVSGYGSFENLILPGFTLGSGLAAILVRMTRTAVLDSIKEDYVRTAKAKGLSKTKVILKHALRNSLIPIITVIGLQVGALLAGSIITETIFSWPGIGTLTVQGIRNRDYPLVQGCVLVIALFYVFTNLITDISYSYADPRVRYGEN